MTACIAYAKLPQWEDAPSIVVKAVKGKWRLRFPRDVGTSNRSDAQSLKAFPPSQSASDALSHQRERYASLSEAEKESVRRWIIDRYDGTTPIGIAARAEAKNRKATPAVWSAVANAIRALKLWGGQMLVQ